MSLSMCVVVCRSKPMRHAKADDNASVLVLLGGGAKAAGPAKQKRIAKFATVATHKEAQPCLAFFSSNFSARSSPHFL